MQGFNIHISDNKVKKSVFFKPDYDSFILENEDLEIAIEGIILNKKQLLQNSGYSDFPSFFSNLFKEKNLDSFKELEGEFRGYIWDKKENEIFVFTNPTASQRVFYFKDKKNVFFDTSLVRLAETLKEEKLLPEPDILALYELISFGNVLMNHTPIKGVKKINDGHTVVLDIFNLDINSIAYFDVAMFSEYQKDKKEALDQLNDLFNKGIELEYKKDLEYNSPHFSLLSGGLDSRMSVLSAIKLGYKPDEVFCFSQSSYFDESISRKIASDYGLKYSFVSLDDGTFLKEIDKLTEISEGCSIYTGGIHVYHAFQKLQSDNFKIIHGGLSGDTILGGFVSEPKRKKPDYSLILVNDMFLDKIKNETDLILNNHESEEVFLLQNRTYNRIILGSQVMKENGNYQISPFMTKDFTQFALSIPESWKYKHDFYFMWLNKYCEEASYYLWEKTLTRPTSLWKKKWGENINKRLYKAYVSVILKKPELTSMYPYQVYYNNSKEIQDYYQNYFEQNIWRLDGIPEFKNDIVKLYNQPDFFRKSQAVNILAIFKLFFN
ncbi:MAG: hypothetical protein DI529_15975 [Chryseobacterium sp.]|nr:MAG: hypothetical protein DI529_15975 [Chryseobacterium sp.]